MDKHNLLRNLIVQHVKEYQVAFLRRLADDIEQGAFIEESEHWAELAETIDDDICNVLNTEYSSNS